MYLQPLYLYRFAKADDRAALARQRLFDCIQCGCCSYVCPAKLPLAEQFALTKQKERAL
jgi:electron transport complex protein RnfC